MGCTEIDSGLDFGSMLRSSFGGGLGSYDLLNILYILGSVLHAFRVSAHIMLRKTPNYVFVYLQVGRLRLTEVTYNVPVLGEFTELWGGQWVIKLFCNCNRMSLSFN